MAKINPNIMFNGNTEEAFGFYQKVFGGEFEALVRYKDMPGDPNEPMPESDANKIMHIALATGKGDLLMGHDIPEKNMGGKMETGNRFKLLISADSKEEADRLFNGLSAGGQIELPIADMGSYFGMLTDKYAVQWMVNFAPANN